MTSVNPTEGQHNHLFPDFLAQNLRVGTTLRVYHVSTPPTPVAPIYSSLPGKQDEPTTCESHFLAVSQAQNATSSTVNSDNDDALSNQQLAANDQVLILGIEILMFTTNSLSTIFVSKADSTGFLPRQSSNSISGQNYGFRSTSTSIIKLIISAFLEWLITHNLSTESRNVCTSAYATDPLHNIDAAPKQQPEDPHIPERDSSTRSRQVDPRQQQAAQGLPLSLAQDLVAEKLPKTVLSLFARSQNQYLFPGSIENPTKHVLDDRQLIKWWCRILDGLVGKEWDLFVDRSGNSVAASALSASAAADSASSIATTSALAAGPAPKSPGPTPADADFDPKVKPQAFVIVPGCDRSETVRSFFPPSAIHAGSTSPWHNSYPVEFLVGQDAIHDAPLPVRCMIPRLPDDPKARYCGDLDNAGIDENGQWRSIKSLPQFWEMMEYRQECAAGRLVGFVWVTFDARNVTRTAQNPVQSIHEPADTFNTHAQPVSVTTSPLEAPHPTSIILSSDQYNTLADFLINSTDFAGLELARKSTNEWIAKVKELSGALNFGVDVEGQATVPAPTPLSSMPQNDGAAEAQPRGGGGAVAGDKHGRDETGTPPRVNVLTGLRKKRKVDVEGVGSGSTAALSATTDGGAVDAGPARTPNELRVSGQVVVDKSAGGVKTLSAGLVRKKPKP